MKPKPTLTEDQEYCRKALSFWVGGDHHLPKVNYWGVGIEINFSGDLSTWDFSRLTQLVLIAHRYSIRIEIGSSGPGRVKVIAHRRKEAGTQSQRHPSIGELITQCGGAARWEDL